MFSFYISHFVFRRQRAKKNRQRKASQNNKYNLTKTLGLMQGFSKSVYLYIHWENTVSIGFWKSCVIQEIVPLP